MEQYINKADVMAEIERLRKNQRLDDRHGQGVLDGLHAIERFLDSLEVKEETPSKELADEIDALSKRYPEVSFAKLSRIAVRVAKWQKEQDEPTASDRGKADEIIIHLKKIEEDYRLCLTDEIQWLRNITKKGE